ncbi:TetR/AcrR family transcriptional regulator [Streptomyces sp. NPDC003691]
MTEPLRVRPRGRPRKDVDPAPVDDALAAALHAFATHGYHGVSVRMLNRELGVSHNLLHQRFGSKSAIWHAAVDWGFTPLVEKLEFTDDPSACPFDRLHAWIRSFVEHQAEHPDLLRLVTMEAGERTERLDYIYDTYIAPAWTHFGALHEELNRQGLIRQVSLRSVFFMITSGGAAVFGSRALARRLSDEDPFTPEEVGSHARYVADTVIAGLKPSQHCG